MKEWRSFLAQETKKRISVICYEASAQTLKLEMNAEACPTLRVVDTGQGIPANERQNVLRRLYRLVKSRTTPGSGPGLSMVKAIGDLHGASVVLSDNRTGLIVTIVLPV